ncbi:hypothetical protein KPL78_04230 [Roseomonas sp. HJA6]|uniref:Transcriptional regulator n=1 Tax=Roseomonas alba TaxID=2846776 RepID=A0ABS7A6V0_9PROT|nr:hypothetical protein [Neoroseomonas alba]MBW6397040.1 hypothetical protein [Neoroseomonas alba]
MPNVKRTLPGIYLSARDIAMEAGIDDPTPEMLEEIEASLLAYCAAHPELPELIELAPPANGDFVAAAVEDIGSLPPDAQATIRTGLLRFLREIGVTPMVDERTGEMMVDLASIASALGMTLEEAMESLRECGADRHARLVPSAYLHPMQ